MSSAIKAGIGLVSATLISFLIGVKIGSVYYEEKTEYDDLLYKSKNKQ